jgi:predicted SAM-dependent methyltransferase
MVEHLTFDEVKLTFNNWYLSLRPGGRVELSLPNMDFHIQQYLDADWSACDLADESSKEAWCLSGFWGKQRDCDPLQDQNINYWDVHKSGFNKQLLEVFLKNAGFSEINVFVRNDVHLCAVAYK